MGETTISWTDTTWNPIRGCRRTAPAGSKQSGCGDPSGGGCYAERQAYRFSGPGQAYEGLVTLTGAGPRWSGKTRLVGEHLVDPMRWRKPRRIFVDSMSDLFYDGFSDEQIAAVFGVMILAAQHTYQILTKRPRRAREWFSRWTVDACLDVLVRTQLPDGTSVPGPREWNRPPRREWYDCEGWPIPWIWLGVSVENQAAADERIPELLATPAAVRFLSCEPLLGPVTLHEDGLDWLTSDHCRGVDWVIAGAESGPRARDCKNEWLRSLRDQCATARVPFFLKQAVAWDDGRDKVIPMGIGRGEGSREKGRGFGGPVIELPYLDGVQHAAFPEVP